MKPEICVHGVERHLFNLIDFGLIVISRQLSVHSIPLSRSTVMTDFRELRETSKQICESLTREQLERDQTQVFDVASMPLELRDAWLTYCAMRRCLHYFLLLHTEIEPLVYATERQSSMRRPEFDLAPSFIEESRKARSTTPHGCETSLSGSEGGNPPQPVKTY